MKTRGYFIYIAVTAAVCVEYLIRVGFSIYPVLILACMTGIVIVEIIYAKRKNP